MSSKLSFSNFGDPFNELTIVDDAVPATLKPGQVHVRVLYAPVNPCDFITVMGYFPVKPPLPAVPGIEGVVEVIRGGTTLKPGDRAVLNTLVASGGVWRQEFVIDEKFLYKVPRDMPVEAAAILIVNPCTAYILLNKIVPMKKGDCLIQNAANSSLGQIVIQLAKAAGIKTINIIRNRPNLQETIDMLKELGADAVITDEQLANGLRNVPDTVDLPAPKLALECVGGKAGGDLAAALGVGGTFVTYGTLSGQPLLLDQMSVIMQDLRIIGFTLNSWMDNEMRADDFGKILPELIDLYSRGKLKLPRFNKFPIREWRSALKMAGQAYTNTKVLLQLN